MTRIISVVRICCLFGTTAALAATDASFYGIAKLQHFSQTNASAPNALSSNGWAFAAFVVARTNFAVTNATVKPSNLTPLRTLIMDTNGTILSYTNEFDTQSALDTTYPTSSGLFSATRYTNTLHTVRDGVRTGVLSFYLLAPLVELEYPSTPRIANFAEAQSIDTSRDFLFRWDTSGGDANQIVQVVLSDAAGRTAFSSPAPLGTGALNGYSNSVVIPAYTLAPGTRFSGVLLFANPGLPNTNGYPGVYGVPIFGKDTVFPAVTLPPARPRLTVQPPVNSQFCLRVSGESNRTYQVQASTNLTAWETLLVTNSPTGVLDYHDPESATLRRRFYRVSLGP